MVFRLATARAALLAAARFLVDGRPGPALRFRLGNPPVFVARRDMVGHPHLSISVFRLVAAWHDILLPGHALAHPQRDWWSTLREPVGSAADRANRPRRLVLGQSVRHGDAPTRPQPPAQGSRHRQTAGPIERSRRSLRYDQVPPSAANAGPFALMEKC